MHDCLSQNWLERYNGARDTQIKLKGHQDTVQHACRMFVADVFDELVSELDAYAMGLSKLVGKSEFLIDNNGKVQFENPGIASACETHRKTIRGLVARLVDEQQFPIWDEAYGFDKAETFEEKKRFIHRKKSETDKIKDLDVQRKNEASKKLDLGIDSDWDFDRIIYYNWHKDQNPGPLSQEIIFAHREFEKVRSKTNIISLIPLYYSLGPVETAARNDADQNCRDDTRILCDEIRDFLRKLNSDQGGHLQSRLCSIQHLLNQTSQQKTSQSISPETASTKT